MVLSLFLWRTLWIPLLCCHFGNAWDLVHTSITLDECVWSVEQCQTTIVDCYYWLNQTISRMIAICFVWAQRGPKIHFNTLEIDFVCSMNCKVSQFPYVPRLSMTFSSNMCCHVITLPKLIHALFTRSDTCWHHDLNCSTKSTSVL